MKVKWSDTLKADGRFSRRQFAFFCFIPIIITYILYAISGAFEIFLIIAVLWNIFQIYIIVVAGIRRLHDLSRSGWYLLLTLVPLVSIVMILYLLFAPGKMEDDRWPTPQAKESTMSTKWKKAFITAVVLLVISIVISGVYIFVLRTELEYNQSQLATTIGELDAIKIRLAFKDEEISATKAKLSASELELKNNKLQLADKEQQLITVNNQLSVKASELTKVSGLLQTTQNEKTQMSTQYSSLRSKILARVGLTQQDRQSYITPNDSAVSAKVQEITGGYNGDTNKLWLDYKKMYTWIVDNISYSYDSYTPVLPESMYGTITWTKGFWRTPAETLKDKTGDCEDMALLLISMLENYNKTGYAIWTLLISSKVPEPKGHMAVAFPVKGGNLTILDPAGNYYTGIQSGYLSSNSIASAVNSWLSHWSKEMPGAFVSQIMSENVDRQFSSSDEFITWASQR